MSDPRRCAVRHRPDAARPLINRIGPRRVSIVGNLLSMAAMVIAPLLYAADALPLWALMVAMAVVGAADRGPRSRRTNASAPGGPHMACR